MFGTEADFELYYEGMKGRNTFEIYGQPHCQDACASARLILARWLYPRVQAVPFSPAQTISIADRSTVTPTSFGFLLRVHN